MKSTVAYLCACVALMMSGCMGPSLAVRHRHAALGPVSIRVDGETRATLAPGDDATLSLDAGHHQVIVTDEHQQHMTLDVYATSECTLLLEPASTDVTPAVQQ